MVSKTKLSTLLNFLFHYKKQDGVLLMLNTESHRENVSKESDREGEEGEQNKVNKKQSFYIKKNNLHIL